MGWVEGMVLAATYPGMGGRLPGRCGWLATSGAIILAKGAMSGRMTSCEAVRAACLKANGPPCSTRLSLGIFSVRTRRTFRWPSRGRCTTSQ